MKSWLGKNYIEKYLRYNEKKSDVAKTFIWTLKNSIYIYIYIYIYILIVYNITSVRKNVLNNKLDDIVNKYNNTYHSKTKMKPVDVKSKTYY